MPDGDGGDLARSDDVLVPTSLSFRDSDNHVPQLTTVAPQS